MSSAFVYFQKAGGVKLVKQFFHAGVLLTAILQFLTLGKSKTALEILRLSVSLKIKKRLANKYRNILDAFDKEWNPNIMHNANKTIWILWWQGMKSAPLLVQKCYESVEKHLGSGWKIVLLTEKNYLDYVSIPDYINEKLKKGQITLTHFSDLLRLELLIKYGGLWLDATVFCTGNEIPQSVLKADLFVFLAQKPGADGMAIPMSSWLMYATTNNKLLMATRKLLYEYWEKSTNMIDYFLLHHFFSIVCDKYSEEVKRIPPFCNSVPHILLLHLFEQFDESFWNDLKKMTCFHKLTYKLDTTQCELNGTYYKHLIQK